MKKLKICILIFTFILAISSVPTFATDDLKLPGVGLGQIDLKAITVESSPANKFMRFPKKETKIETRAKITDIDIWGNYYVDSKPIIDAIFSRVGETLVPAKIKADLKAIYALGYFSDVTSEFEDHQDGTRVIFKVIENPALRTIRVHNNTAISTKEIRSVMKNQSGKILNFKHLQADIQSINALYKEKGYTLARVANVDTDAKNHVLHIYVIEGIIESIVLEGNKNTKDYVVLRELHSKPGSVFNEKVLSKDLKRVFNLGYFSELNPVFEPGSTKEKIVMILKIKESRTSTINFGGGYGEAEGWFGFIDLSVNNLFGTARNILIRGQTGQELQTYQFKYTDPWFLPNQLGPRSGFSARRWFTVGTDIYMADEDKVRNGWDLSLTKQLRENFNITYTLGSEKVDPYNAATFEAYIQDTVGVTFSYDTRDFWLNPSAGALYSLSLKEGWKHTSYTSGFFKIGVDFNQYIPIVEGQTFAAHVGSGAGFGDVPEGELYWAGGANTIRGYYPTDARTGRKKFILNLEHRVTFNDVFQGVLFIDWGNAWNDGYLVPSDFITGWGPGIRLTTPLGPIRLDYGVPSGQNFGEGIIHFSIGQAF